MRLRPAFVRDLGRAGGTVDRLLYIAMSAFVVSPGHERRLPSPKRHRSPSLSAESSAPSSVAPCVSSRNSSTSSEEASLSASRPSPFLDWPIPVPHAVFVGQVLPCLDSRSLFLGVAPSCSAFHRASYAYPHITIGAALSRQRRLRRMLRRRTSITIECRAKPSAVDAVVRHADQVRSLSFVCTHANVIAACGSVTASQIANLISTRRLHTLNMSRSSHSNSSSLPTLIAALPSLTSLGVPGCPRIAAAILAEGSNALHRQLTSLDVSHCNLPAQSLTSVPLQRLRSLSCAGNPALRGLPALIFTLPAIESFDMDGCTFDPEYDDPITEPHMATSTFTLPRASPTSADIPDLSPCGPARDAESEAGDAVEREPISMRKASATRSSALSSLLSKLTMASCSGVTDDAVGELVARLPGVTYLDVSYNTALTSASLHSIARHCPRIRHLFASGCERMHTRDAIAVVATLSPSLRSASLGSLPLRAGTWPVLSKVVLCRQRDVSRLDGFGSSAPLLSHVNLANNATLRDAHLASLRLPNLVSLTVSACVGVRGTGIAALLSRSTVLTTLRMSLCAISSDALHEILEACGATLTSLDIGLCTSVDVRGVRGIASRAPRIQQMVLGNRRALSGLTGQDVLHVMDALADLHTLDLYQVDARIVVACGQRGTIRPCITAHEVDRDGISSDLIKHVAVAVSTNPNHPDTIDLALR